MTPILGILASQISGHLSTNSYESIATVTVGSGGASGISFTSIPSTYKHLQIRWIARSTAGASTDYFFPMYLNNDPASNYSSHYINANGSAVAASGNANQNGFNFYGDWPAASATSGIFGAAVMDITDYRDTNKYKTIRTFAGFDANGSGQVFFNSASWRSTNAVTSIQLYFNSANFAQYSSFALYGVKG